MSSNGQEKRTLEERLEQAARSQASSPEAALRQVQQLAQMHSALVFTGEEDLQLMDGLIGESLNALEEEVMHYGGFCRSFLLAREPEQPFRPFMGTQASSAANASRRTARRRRQRFILPISPLLRISPLQSTTKGARIQ